MRRAIRTLEVPPGAAGAFAVIPAASPTAATNGGNLVYGAPGTVPVSAPRPAAMTDGSWGGQWQGSANGPQWTLPSHYVALPGTGWVKPRRRGEKPVPAAKAATPIAAGMGASPNLGIRVTPSVRPFITWPTVGKG